MTSSSYGAVLATAMQLLGRRVIVHWLDDDGEVCGAVGVLTQVTEARKDADGKEVPRRVVLENPYSSVSLEQVTHIRQAIAQ